MHAGTAIRTHLCPVLVLVLRSNTPQRLSNAYHESKTPVPETIHNEPHDYLSLLSSLTQSLRDSPPPLHDTSRLLTVNDHVRVEPIYVH